MLSREPTRFATSRSSSGRKCAVCPRSQPAGRGRRGGPARSVKQWNRQCHLGLTDCPGSRRGLLLSAHRPPPQRLWRSHPAGCSAACWVSAGAGSALRHLPQCGRAAVLGAPPAAHLLAETHPPPRPSPVSHRQWLEARRAASLQKPPLRVCLWESLVGRLPRAWFRVGCWRSAVCSGHFLSSGPLRSLHFSHRSTGSRGGGSGGRGPGDQSVVCVGSPCRPPLAGA